LFAVFATKRELLFRSAPNSTEKKEKKLPIFKESWLDQSTFLLKIRESINRYKSSPVLLNSVWWTYLVKNNWPKTAHWDVNFPFRPYYPNLLSRLLRPH